MNEQKSSAEYKAENEKLLAELEKPETPVEQKKEEAAAVDTEAVKVDPEEAEVSKVSDQKPETPVEQKKEEDEEKKPEPDWKKKFSDSSREAQKSVAASRKLNQAIDEANELPDPTEEELKVEYSNWDQLDDTNKKIAKDNLINNRRFSLITKGRSEAQKIEKWGAEVDKFIDDPHTLIDNADLEGKVDEFKLFANEETNHNVPLSVLVSSFLYKKSKEAKPKSKGSMFPTGSGGPQDKTKPKTDKISLQEAESLRKTNYNKYKELLTAGKISTEI